MFKRKQNHLQYETGPRDLVIIDEPKSPVSEQFRTIRTNITYSSIDTEIKSVLFTSATPNAGKSTTAANVAVAYAQSGKKTLILDADLRRPTMHYTFEMNNQRGLSTAIVNEMEVEEMVRPTDIDNLDVITSGPIPPNPSELIASNKMAQFFKILTLQYDMVIVDSPPILAVTDGQLLSKLVDGTIMVTDVEQNNRDVLTQAKELLHKADASITGVVLNNKKMDTDNNYYYYYGSE